MTIVVVYTRILELLNDNLRIIYLYLIIRNTVIKLCNDLFKRKTMLNERIKRSFRSCHNSETIYEFPTVVYKNENMLLCLFN